jgi:hypothetical protein
VNVVLAPPVSDTGADKDAVDACAPPVETSAGARGATPVAVAPPVLRTVMVRLKAWPRLSEGGKPSEVTERAAGVCTSIEPDDTGAADTVDPELASLPETPAESWSVPAPAPFSWNVQLKIAVEPPGMSARDGALDVDAEALPAAAMAGGPGAGNTASASASPEFRTVRVATKSCRESMAAGAVKESMCSVAGTWTVAPALAGGGEGIAAPLFASTPTAVAEIETVPWPDPDSTNPHWNVVEAPPARDTGAGAVAVEAAAEPPATIAGAVGETPDAVAWPVFRTNIVTTKDCLLLRTAGAENDSIESAAWTCTMT